MNEEEQGRSAFSEVDLPPPIGGEATQQHTPTPWILDARVGCLAIYPEDTPEEQSHCLDGAEGWAVHFAHGRWVDDHWVLSPEDVANAKLIAAAPDLLEACKLADGTLLGCSANRLPPHARQRLEGTRKKLEAAIAKATQ